MKSIEYAFVITFMGILIPNYSYSQKNYKPGYVIDIHNDTIKGLIDYRNWDKTPKIITFKSVSGSNVNIYTPTNIQSFSVADELYISGIIKIDESTYNDNDQTYAEKFKNRVDTVFVQSLIEGEKSLYYLKDENLKGHFFIGQNGSLETLVFNNYLEEVGRTTYSKTNDRFKGQLIIYLKDCSSIQKKIYNVRYIKNDLISLFNEYYKCTQNKIAFQPKMEKNKSELGFFGGLSLTRIKFTGNEAFNSLVYAAYPFSSNPTLGIFFNIVLPRKQGRWSINNEVMFTSFKVKGHYLEYENVNIYTDYYSSIGTSYIKLNNLLKFKYPIKKMFFFIDGGISNGLAVSMTNYLKNESHIYSVTSIYEAEALKNTRKMETGYIIGLGSNIKNYSFELRIERSNGMSTYMQLSSPIMRCFFILGYKF